MEKTILTVEGMSCEHCVKAVINAISPLPGVNSVLVDLEKKTVTVEHDPASTAVSTIQSEIEDQGYDVIS